MLSFKNRYLGQLVSVAVVAAIAVVSAPAAIHGQDEGGSADAAIPISSFDELCLIGADADHPLDGDYELTADINASGSRDLDGGAGFSPIGRRVVLVLGGFGVPDVVDTTKAFTGTFDGKGYKISGLYIRRTAEDAANSASNIGLFGFACGARIRGLTVVADTIVGYSHVGALAGRLSGSVVERCVAVGAVLGQAAVGGLVGALDNGSEVRISYSLAEVGGENAVDVGGLAGSGDALITESYSIGRVSVDSGDRVGGLVGSLAGRAKLLNCYSMAAVSGGGAFSVGGLVGAVTEDGGEVRQCYSAGAVSGDGGDAGGLIGKGGGAIYSFWDTDRSGYGVSAGGTGAVGRTTALMMDSAAAGVRNLVSADTAAWGISNNYPYLKNVFFPRHAVTVTATRGGALSGATAAGGASHTQTVNHWVEWNTVVAKPSLETLDDGTVRTIVDSLDGWYLAGSDTALAVGPYYGFSVTQASSDSGATGKLSLSDLAADSAVAIEARFILKKYTLRYIAFGGRGSVVSMDDNEGIRADDTLTKSVEHGAVSLVNAAPKVGYNFLQWGRDQNEKSLKDTARADTALSDMNFLVYFADSAVELTYVAGSNGRLCVNDAPPPYINTHTVKPQFGANGPSILAVPISDKYIFVMWDDSVTANPRTDSAVVASFVVTALFDSIPVSVKSPNRVVPGNRLTNETAQIQPIKAGPTGLTAGPNPALRQSGNVGFYWQGANITGGTLLIFDASGNFVNKISVGNANNNTVVINKNSGADKRPIASWNLTDANGKPAGAGTYLIKGTLQTKNGSRERASLVLVLI